MSRFGKLVFSLAALLVIAGAGATARADTIMPEPSSILLLGGALVGIGGIARKKLKTRN